MNYPKRNNEQRLFILIFQREFYFDRNYNFIRFYIIAFRVRFNFSSTKQKCKTWLDATRQAAQQASELTHKSKAISVQFNEQH